ncbi:MAG: ribosomal protein [Pseudomonadota bacterium]|jgi:small subunit ribosomal protein S6
MANTAVSGVIPGYETTFITKSEMSDEALQALKARLTAVLGQFGGELVLSEDWGKRKLAYPISKEVRGQYTYFVYTGKGDVVHEMERNLRLNDQVLRFLSVNLDKEFDAESFKKARAEQQAAAKRREDEREARREERAGYSDRRYRQDSVERSGDMGAASLDEEI